MIDMEKVRRMYDLCTERAKGSIRWLQAYTDNFDLIPFGQEIHPITGAPTPCSAWSIGGMNFYRYVVRRLEILK